MVHPSGEGPCAVVELGGGVLIPSWSDHTIDYFPLVRKGAGYTSQRIPLVRGSDFFRPTCMTAGPDGTFYLNDWVFSSYPIHGRGRLWKLEIDQPKAAWMKAAPEPMNDAARLAKELREGKAKPGTGKLLELARGGDSYLSDAALTALARESKSWTPKSLKAMPATDRVWALVALRRVNLGDEKWVRELISDKDPEVRFECLRWIADAVLTGFSADVEKMLSDPNLDFRLFEAVLATWNTLRGEPGAGVTNPDVLVERIINPATPAKLKGYALRLAPASHKQLTVPVLRELFSSGDPVLSLEAVRTLSARNADDARAALATIADDESQPTGIRAEAIAGLASSTILDQQTLLQRIAAGDNATLSKEARRALRFTEHDKSFTMSIDRPAFENTAAWMNRLNSLAGKADAEAGRRIFFHSKVGLCASCHRHSGRGNVVGPDLSLIARQGDRAAILRSILEPNREVAPQFYPTQLKLKDGTDFIGILLRSSDRHVFRDLTGKERSFFETEIAQRSELKSSLMPMGLVSSLTDSELRDLLAFLTSTNSSNAQ
jgi:putative heme-binding domain-containing protein